MDALAAALMVEAALVDQLTAALRQAPITVASPTRPLCVYPSRTWHTIWCPYPHFTR
jgi:hypothetical protein